MTVLQNRLNQVLSKIENPRFLKSDGLGNEVGFWIFDYPAAEELRVREYLNQLEKKMQSRGHKFEHIHVFKVVLSLLQERDLLERAIAREKEVGASKIKKMLAAPLHQKKIAAYIAKKYDLNSLDFVLISGLGSAWPLVRGHELLSSLQDVMGKTPLVLFYPGEYSGYDLHPFGLVESKNYYRAFKLVP